MNTPTLAPASMTANTRASIVMLMSDCFPRAQSTTREMNTNVPKRAPNAANTKKTPVILTHKMYIKMSNGNGMLSKKHTTVG